MTRQTPDRRAAEPAFTIVEDEPGLARLTEAALEARVFGLDTEFLREKTYYARLCLTQVALPGEVFLLDPTHGLDLQPIGDLLANPDVEVVVHAGGQDLQIFYERCRAIPRNVFDVQIAAAFVGLGSNLPYGGLVRELLGVHLQKGEAYSDWCRRPLTPAQLRYAADDVRYLMPMANELKNQLAELGRTEWAREELAAFSSDESYASRLDDAWRKVTGHGALAGQQLTTLQAVARWREEMAARRDVPRSWFMKDPTLIEIARRAPGTLAEIKTIRGIDPKEAERSGESLLEAIRKSAGLPPARTRSGPPRATAARSRMIASLASSIVQARAERARIASELIATRGELEALLMDVLAGNSDADSHRLMRGWRFELAGEAVVALAEGRIALRVTSQPPYVEETAL